MDIVRNWFGGPQHMRLSFWAIYLAAFWMPIDPRWSQPWAVAVVAIPWEPRTVVLVTTALRSIWPPTSHVVLLWAILVLHFMRYVRFAEKLSRTRRFLTAFAVTIVSPSRLFHCRRLTNLDRWWIDTYCQMFKVFWVASSALCPLFWLWSSQIYMWKLQATLSYVN